MQTGTLTGLYRKSTEDKKASVADELPLQNATHLVDGELDFLQEVAHFRKGLDEGHPLEAGALLQQPGHQQAELGPETRGHEFESLGSKDDFIESNNLFSLSYSLATCFDNLLKMDATCCDGICHKSSYCWWLKW